MDPLKKAQLVLGGAVSLPEGYDNELFEHRDGIPVSAVFTIDNTVVRKKISDDGEFELKVNGDVLSMTRNGEPFIDTLGVKHMFCHSPDLAVISLGKKGKVLSTEEAIGLLKRYNEDMELKGISLHGGSDCSEDHYVKVLGEFRKICPTLHIGVGQTDCEYDPLKLKEAGADNYKTTFTSFIPRVAEILDIDPEEKYNELERIIGIFGRGNVVCTTYLGLGETDEEVKTIIEKLCSIGIMPDIKVVKATVMIKAMEEKLGKLDPTTPERYATIAKFLKSTMEKHGLEPSNYTTMCYGCRLCTLIPFKDF